MFGRKGNVDVFSQGLLVRAGYVQQLSAGILTAMHFGMRSLRKTERKPSQLFITYPFSSYSYTLHCAQP